MPLVGYSDRLAVAPGETIRFMVSSDHPRYRRDWCGFIHGDTNPDGPGFKQVIVPSALDGERAGEHHAIRSGSYAEIPVDKVHSRAGFTFVAFVSPTLPGRDEQALHSHGDPFHGAGLAIALDEMGALELVIGTGDGLEPRASRPAPRCGGGSGTWSRSPSGTGAPRSGSRPSGAGPTTRRTRR